MNIQKEGRQMADKMCCVSEKNDSQILNDIFIFLLHLLQLLITSLVHQFAYVKVSL